MSLHPQANGLFQKKPPGSLVWLSTKRICVCAYVKSLGSSGQNLKELIDTITQLAECGIELRSRKQEHRHRHTNWQTDVSHYHRARRI